MLLATQSGETAQDIAKPADITYHQQQQVQRSVGSLLFSEALSCHHLCYDVRRGCWAQFCCPRTRLQFGLSIPTTDLRTTGGPKKLWSFHHHDSNTMVWMPTLSDGAHSSVDRAYLWLKYATASGCFQETLSVTEVMQSSWSTSEGKPENILSIVCNPVSPKWVIVGAVCDVLS